MQTLREILGRPPLFHIVTYHGKDGAASLTGYDSRNPNTITHQLKAMQALGGEGTGVVALSYGPTVSTFMHQAVMTIGAQANALGMPFALCFDPWTVKGAADVNKAMIACLTNPDIQFLLGMDCYLPGKPVLDFATGCSDVIVKASVPGIQYWLVGRDYDWPKIPPVPNKTALPCVHLEFDDGTGKDRNKSVWDQTQPARITPSYAGATWWNDVSTLGMSQYVQVVTWNDVAEGTDVEKFASVLWGRI